MKNNLMKIMYYIQIAWSVFIAIGAYYGAFLMFYDKTGSALSVESLLPSLQVLPLSDLLFQNFIFSGISLLIVNGLSNTAAASLAGMMCGIILMLWVCIQFIIFGWNNMSALFFVFGLLQMINGLILFIKTNKR